MNQQSVLREILLTGPVSRSEIAGRIGITASAASRIVRPLIDAGLVRELPHEGDDRPVKPGRRVVPLGIDPEGGQVLGISIGATFQAVTLADLGNNAIAGMELEMETLNDPDRVVRHVVREGRRLIDEHLEERRRLFGGLFAIIAPVDPVRGGVLGGPYLGWDPFPLGPHLAGLLNLPVKVRPMAATIAMAEMLFGKIRGRNNALTLLCGLGIGAAVILNGRAVEGDRFPTGAIGDMELTGEDGTVATLDELGSGFGILRRLHGKEMARERMPLAGLARALLAAVERDRAGDPVVSAVMTGAGRELGRFIVQFARFVAPEAVLIVGPLSRSPSYLSAVRAIIATGMAPRPPQVVAGPVRNNSACCAMAIYEYLIERPLDLPALTRGPE